MGSPGCAAILYISHNHIGRRSVVYSNWCVFIRVLLHKLLIKSVTQRNPVTVTSPASHSSWNYDTSTECPYDSKGQLAKGSHVHLLGKHFAYKGAKCGRCSVCYFLAFHLPPIRKKTIIVKSVMYTCVWVDVCTF